jgi:hypothetical protein
MSLTTTMHPLAFAGCLIASLAFAAPGQLQAREPLPQVSPEGLQLQPDTKVRAVYLKPGATFDKYHRVAIVNTYVEFAKDWEREYNDTAVGLQGRVRPQDMERMKTGVAAAFKEVFTEELQDKGGYQVVDAAAADVLVLRPAIINLQVTAPDLHSANMKQTIVRSAGQMTLYLELWDSSTNTLLARIMDPQADDGIGGVATRATNRYAMNEILEDWAVRLRKHLDAAHGKAPRP